MPAKKGKRKKHHTRRRVGARGKSGIGHFILKVVGVGGGAIAAAFGVQAVDTAAGASLPAWAAPAGAVATGALIAGGVGHLKGIDENLESLAEGFGLGMIAVGGIMVANETFMNVPGIAGLAMSSNAGPANGVLRQAVSGKSMSSNAGPANNTLRQAVSGVRPGFINQTVGKLRRDHSALMGALVSD
jgi:hypothetical protein